MVVALNNAVIPTCMYVYVLRPCELKRKPVDKIFPVGSVASSKEINKIKLNRGMKSTSGQE